MYPFWNKVKAKEGGRRGRKGRRRDGRRCWGPKGWDLAMRSEGSRCRGVGPASGAEPEARGAQRGQVQPA